MQSTDKNRLREQAALAILPVTVANYLSAVIADRNDGMENKEKSLKDGFRQSITLSFEFADGFVTEAIKRRQNGA